MAAIVNEDLTRKLERAKVKMLLKMAYFGNFILGVPVLKASKVEEKQIDTAATNARWIKYNEAFFNGLSRDEIIFVLGHETLHIAFKHPLRRGFRNPQLFNIACDIPINLILLDSKIGLMPKTVKDGFWEKIQPDRFKGMSAETIYDILEAERQKQGGGRSFKSGKMVIDLDNPPKGAGQFEDCQGEGGRPLSESEAAGIEQAIDALSANAAAAAKSQGTLPADIERLVYEMLKPKVDWRERLRKFVGKTIPNDLTWKRPARSGLGLGLYLPSIKKTGCGKIAIFIDTSGSVGADELAQFWAEVVAIYEDANPESLEVIYCAESVSRHDSFHFGETPVMGASKSGGTDFRPPFKRLAKKQIIPQCAIYLTDMMGPFPEGDEIPNYPVLWVATTDIVGPFGETIPIRL